MSDRPDRAPDEPQPAVSHSERRFEILATALLAVAALATAWSGYQASLWDGIQSSNYTQASAARTNAAQKLTEANQYRLADL
jgi:type VI protein secretion system component VasF